MAMTLGMAMGGAPSFKKRSRRGKRGSGKGMADANHAAHVAHLKAAHDAVRKGDHAAAKRHAFAFVKSLPSTMQGGMGAMDEPEPMQEANPKAEAMEAEGMAPKPSKMPAMAAKMSPTGGNAQSKAMAALMARRMKAKK